MKRTAALCISLLLFPYLFTLAWTGRAEGMIQMESSAAEQRMVILDRGGNAYPVPVEDYIIGMAAMQIPADYEKETIKAQMIIARTYLYSLMGEESSIPESAIDADIMTEKEMRKAWGKESFLDCCQTSVEYVNSNIDEAAKMMDSYGIVASEVAQKAIPSCNIVFIEGSEMKEKLSGYLSVLFEQNVKSVGGTLPDDDFYYKR